MPPASRRISTGTRPCHEEKAGKAWPTKKTEVEINERTKEEKADALVFRQHLCPDNHYLYGYKALSGRHALRHLPYICGITAPLSPDHGRQRPRRFRKGLAYLLLLH